MVAHLTCSILSRNALMPASLDMKPMRSCPKLSNNMPEMLVAAILNVRIASVSHFDVPVHLGLAGVVNLSLSLSLAICADYADSRMHVLCGTKMIYIYSMSAAGAERHMPMIVPLTALIFRAFGNCNSMQKFCRALMMPLA